MRAAYFFIDYMHQGGLIMWPILAVAVLAWYLGIRQTFRLLQYRGERHRFLELVQCGNPLERTRFTLELYQDLAAGVQGLRSGSIDVRVVRQEYLQAVPVVLFRSLNTMKTLIATAPLLGLLGTVVGMVRTFRIITEYGLGNPHFMAQGISIALLTTQAGLTVAFPAMLLLNFLNNRAQRLQFAMRADSDLFDRVALGTHQIGE